MHKRYDLLDEMRECYRHGTEFRRNDVVLTKDEVRAFLYRLREYYEINDIETGDVHGKIFAALYIDGKFANYYSLANEINADVVALYRFRKRYNKLAEKLLECNSVNKNSIEQNLFD